MAIDSIGKPPAPVMPPTAGEVGGVRLPTESFKVGAMEPASTEASAFERLERGELSKEQYLELRIEEAVSPLVHTLSPDQLEFVRQTLRERLAEDPLVSEMARRVTAGAGER